MGINIVCDIIHKAKGERENFLNLICNGLINERAVEGAASEKSTFHNI